MSVDRSVLTPGLDAALVPDVATEKRARKLALVLDPYFESYNELIVGEEIEFAAHLLRQFERSGVRVVFPDDQPPVPQVLQ